MPTSQATRTIQATVQELWEVVSDPHHLPRWWPRVERVEDVDGDAFTEVMKTGKGKVVKADFRLIGLDEQRHVATWAQQVLDTPFERLLRSAETEVQLAAAEPDAPVTEVTLQLRQTLNDSLSKAGFGRWVGLGSYFKGFGNHMVRRAGTETLEQALDGLQRISGRV